MKLQANFVLLHALAGQPGPVDRQLAFFEVLLGGTRLIVEIDDPVMVHRHVGNNETDAGEQLTRMPFDPGDKALGLVPKGRLLLEVTVQLAAIVGRALHRRAENCRRQAGMPRAPGPIRPTPGDFVTSCNMQGEKRLIN